MADKKQYTSVSDVLRDVAPDDAFQADFDQHVAERRLIKELLALRAVRGLSQREVADFIGCSQGRISKLENAKDADVRFGYLQEYADALGCDLMAQPVPRDMKPRPSRNEPAFLKHIASRLASIYKMPESDFIDQVTQTTTKFYDL